MQTALSAIFGIGLIAVVLWEAFETIVLPRRVTRRWRLTRLFYRATWKPFAALVSQLFAGKRRETYLGFYGPLSLLLLLSVWAVGLVFGFALLHWGFGSELRPQEGATGFTTDLYMSGTTFFTLGLGDVVPRTQFARVLTVLEAGLGFGFLAMVIGYLPVLYQSFSRREVNISLLDARAGSPPTAAELLRRHAHNHGMDALHELLRDWERWSAELLESHLSYPVLCLFRSQHDNQSWLAALTTILDTSALVMVGIEGACGEQAQLTFAMARHAMVDLAQIFSAAPRESATDRLSSSDLEKLRDGLQKAGLPLRDGPAANQRLLELRRMYEPYVHALAINLYVNVPAWVPLTDKPDNWQTSAWGRAAGLRQSKRRGVG